MWFELAAEKSGWGKRNLGKGSGLGIAVHRSFLTYVATVVEVEVDDKGEVKIPSVHTAVDAGIVVNPEATRAQFEGAAVFGTSIVRSGAITARNGVIEQSNFNDYPVARMNEAPYKTTVHIVESDAPAGRGWRTRSASLRARALQRDLRRHRKAHSRIAALQKSPDRIDALEGAPSKLRLGGVFGPPEKVDTIADFDAVKRFGVQSKGGADAATASVVAELADLVAQGELEVPIAAVFALDDVREAYRQVELRHTRGKMVLRP